MKKYLSLLLCILLSAGIWLIHNLSQNYSSIVNVPVVVASNIEGHARVSSTEASVSGRITASGFRLLRLRLSRTKPVEVFMDAQDFTPAGNDYFNIPLGSIYKYAGNIFGNEVRTESVITDGLSLRFSPENCRKLPVKPVLNLGFKAQYMAAAPVKLTPDSVLVYGDPAWLDNLDAVLTHSISLSDIKRSVHGLVELETPSNTRLSAQEAEYNISVTRFVEISGNSQIAVRNVPNGTRLSVLPSTAKISFKCVFPMISDPTSSVSLYVDYKEFMNSINGKCLVYIEDLPDGVIEYNIDPQVCDCFLETDFR